MTLTGELLIADTARRGLGKAFNGINATTGETIATPAFHGATKDDVNAAVAAASDAFESFRALSLQTRADLLEAMATEIAALGDTLTERAMDETGLPRARLQGESGRLVGQLRMFAALVRSGDALDVRVEPALPDRVPPRHRIAMQRLPLGPVVVFGASNFPLAFSVAGGDTAAALAAGCPVVVKAHPAHPGTSELVGRAVQKAVRSLGLPAGIFSLLFDAGYEVGADLVAHPDVQAVGFTGSRAGGLALVKIAAARAQPIPVYAEMSSVNPTLLLPGALKERAEKTAVDFVASLTLGSGQFCTNPGLVLAVKGADLDRFLATVTTELDKASPGAMLTPGIRRAYDTGMDQLCRHEAVTQVGRSAGGKATPEAAVFRVAAATFRADPALSHEVFGPAALVVECADEAELIEVLKAVEGQLTVTLQLEPADYPLARQLLSIAERKAGRVLVNGYPTGVEVCDAMVHGGPFPSTSDGRSTSVGTAAIERFLRPVCYQNVPDELLAPSLKQDNPLALTRRVAGVVTKAS